MNWPNFLNANCGYAFSKESCILGAKNYAKIHPGVRSKNLQKGKDKAHKYLKENKLGYYNPEVQSKGGKIGGAKLRAEGRFQTDEWRKLSSRADYIWYTDGNINARIHKNFKRNFELDYPTWKKGIIIENLKIPNNKGRVYLHHPYQEGVKRFIFPDSDLYQELLKQGYYSKTNHKFA